MTFYWDLWKNDGAYAMRRYKWLWSLCRHPWEKDRMVKLIGNLSQYRRELRRQSQHLQFWKAALRAKAGCEKGEEMDVAMEWLLERRTIESDSGQSEGAGGNGAVPRPALVEGERPEGTDGIQRPEALRDASESAKQGSGRDAGAAS